MQPYRIPIWKQAPMLRMVVPMIAGIACQYYLDIPDRFVYPMLIVGSLFFFLFYRLPIHFRYQFQIIQSALIVCMIVSLAMLITNRQDLRKSDAFFLHHADDDDLLLLRINEPLTRKQHTYTTIADVAFVVKGNHSIPVKGKLNLILKQHEKVKCLRYGDWMMVMNKVQPVKNFGNPGEFDKKRYCEFQQVYHQLYLKESDFMLPGINNSNWFYKIVYFLRDKTISVLRKNISNDKGSLGIAEALLIGYKNDLDRQMVQAYSNTGVVHIIAISGMHLGLIYMALIWLLEKISFISDSRLGKGAILLTCLWVFSLMTGGSASVLRSAVMFTCIIIGNMLDRKSNVYNSLASSAFLLLSYNPFLLWDTGFQLSYCAIIGIVWLQKPIQNVSNFRHVLLKKIWEMCSITIAAQVITLPVCLFWFHQFPVYFLLSNLVAVPLSTVVLFEETVLLIFSSFHMLAAHTGRLIDISVTLMNQWIMYINRLPGSLIDMIYADLYTTVLLFLLLSLFIMWLLYGNRNLLKWSLLILTIFSFWQSIARQKRNDQKLIIVYHVPKSTAIDVVKGKSCFSYADQSLYGNLSSQQFFLSPSRKHFLVTCDSFMLFSNPMIIHFSGKSLAMVDAAFAKTDYVHPDSVDFLVVSGNPDISIRHLFKKIRFQKIIFDASNSLWKITKWKKECDSLHLQCFSANEEGAFIVRLR